LCASLYSGLEKTHGIGPNAIVTSNNDRIPENVVLQSNGQRMKAWLTFDKKQQYMKRCPALWTDVARQFQAVYEKVLR